VCLRAMKVADYCRHCEERERRSNPDFLNNPGSLRWRSR
jgi:hypothetical protein